MHDVSGSGGRAATERAPYTLRRSGSGPPLRSLATLTPRRPLFRGWYIAAAAFVATFGSVVFFNPVLGVFAQLLEAEFGWRRSEVALAIAFGSLAAGITGPFVGAVIDRWGGRWVIGGAALGMSACALILSQMDALWQLLVFYALGRALAMGVVSPAGFVAVANWFVRRRALVSGIVAVGPRLGMAVFPVLVAVVVDVTGSWRAGFVALAIAAAIVAVPAMVVMRRRPEDVGLRPDGDPEPVDLAALPRRPERTLTLRQAVRTRAYWFLGISLTIVMFCGGAVNFHQIPHLVDQGIPRTQAALVVTIFSVVGATGAILGGLVATRLTMRWTMAISLVGMSGGVLLLSQSATMATAALYAVTYGIFFGSQVSLEQVVYADYFGRRAMGTIRGSFMPVQLSMNAAGPFLVGLWYDAAGSYTGAFTTFAVLFMVAALAIALASYPADPADAPQAA
jgi:MFS family permease